MKITVQEMIDIADSGNIDGKIEGDNLLHGMQILSKYFDVTKERIMGGATSDEVWGPSLTKLEERGIIKDDFIALLEINWFYDADIDCIACFV